MNGNINAEALLVKGRWKEYPEKLFNTITTRNETGQD
jgi:hypothetical protein